VDLVVLLPGLASAYGPHSILEINHIGAFSPTAADGNRQSDNHTHPESQMAQLTCGKPHMRQTKCHVVKRRKTAKKVF
jgi:hypothetical protein